MTAHAQSATRPRQDASFDTDSRELRIDNCASRCITNSLKDFVSPPIPAHNRRVQGINGYTNSLVRIGTIRWEIEDDEGRVHDLIIPESIYLPEATSRLLSPQHWAQSTNDNKPNLNGTWCATYQDKIILYWKQGQHRRTVNLDAQGNNVAFSYFVFLLPRYTPAVIDNGSKPPPFFRLALLGSQCLKSFGKLKHSIHTGRGNHYWYVIAESDL
jgi:hypothetical protein